MSEFQIPDDWKICRLGDVANTQSGGTPNRGNSKYFEGDIPWLKSGELKDDEIVKAEERITQQAIEDSNARIFPKGTLLVALYGATAGRTGILGIPAATNQAICAVMPKDGKFVSNFMMYYLMFQRETLLRQRYGAAQPNISQQILRSLEVTLPPIPEQIRIAHTLNVLQGATKASQGVLEIMFDLRKSTLQHIFSYGPITIDEIKRVKLVGTALGPLPDHWDVATLKSVVKSYKNGIYKKAEFYGKGFPSVRMFNIREGVVDTKGSPLLEVTEQELKDFGLNESDILINRVNSGDLVGKTALVPPGLGPITFESKNIRVRVDQKTVIPEFFVMWTRTPQYVSQIRQMVRAAVGQATVNQGDLDRIMFPLPPLEEQRKSVQMLQAIEHKIRAERERRDSLSNVFKSLLTELISGKLRQSFKGN